jgi:hypothetical protein
MKVAIMMRWGGIKPGHGEAAVANAYEGFELLDSMVERGKVLSYDIYYGMQQSGGCAVVMLEQDQVMDVVLDPGFAAYDTAAGMLWEGWEWSLYMPHESAQEAALPAWAKAATTLA